MNSAITNIKKSVLLCKKRYKIVGIQNTEFKDYVLYNIHIQLYIYIYIYVYIKIISAVYLTLCLFL